MTSPESVGRIVFWLALANILVAVFGGLSRRGDPIWPDARLLFISGGALLILLGMSVVTGHAVWIGAGGGYPLAAGTMLALIGLALVGAGLHDRDPDGPWRLLTLPGLLATGAGLTSLAVRWRSSAVLREMATYGSSTSQMARAALVVSLLLLWPAGIAWALGLVAP